MGHSPVFRISTRGWVVALYPLSSAILLGFSGALGPYGAALDHVGGLLLCALVTRLGWTITRRATGLWRSSSTVVIGLGWVSLLLAPDRAAWLFGVAAILAGLALRGAALGSTVEPAFRSLALLAWMYASWFLARSSSAAVWKAENALATSLAQAVGALFDVDLRLGGTLGGLEIAFLHTGVVALWLAHRAGASRVSLRRCVVGLSVPWGLQAAYLACLCLILRSDGKGEELLRLAANWLLLARAGVEWLVLSVLLLRFGYAPAVGEKVFLSSPWAIRLGNGLAGLATLALLGHEIGWSQALTQARPGRLFVVGDESGSGLSSSHAGLWERAKACGFSVQPYVRSGGGNSALETSLEEGPAAARESAGNDLYVVPFPTPSWLAEESPQILRAVEHGAGLLALSDHTNAVHTADSLRPLIGPAGFAIAFDSIDSLTGRWFDATELHRHPLAPHWRGARNARYGIGASVEVPWSGELLFVGRYAWADRGDLGGIPNNYIGDRQFAEGELLGDCALVASASYGAGRVLVAGDPEFLLSSTLPASSGIARACLAYLAASPPRWIGSGCLRWIGLASLCGATVLYVACRSAAPWAGAALGLTCWISQAAFLQPSPFQDRPGERQVLAAVGFHGTVSAPETSRGLLDGFIETLDGQGYIVECDELDTASVHLATAAVIVRPYAPLSENDQETLIEFVRRGKALLLSIGYQQRAAVARLLEVAGVQMMPRLLGRGFDASTDTYGDSDPLLFREAYALNLAPGSRARALYSTSSGDIAVAETEVGAGRIVVIGDPSFLLGGNLTNAGRSFPQNQALLLRALSGP